MEAEAVHSEDPSSPPSPPPPSVATVPAVESAVGVVEGPVALCCCGSDEGTLVAAVDVTGCACWLDSASPSLLAELACAREVDVQGNYYNTEILQHIHNIQLCHNVMSKEIQNTYKHHQCIRIRIESVQKTTTCGLKQVLESVLWSNLSQRHIIVL